ncbi:hypothetical protein ZWY2020_039617 [Hordeum vulgare]|nr:hypothetical protein ZWY2020_039617 [Hordeum vulgare]
MPEGRKVAKEKAKKKPVDKDIKVSLDAMVKHRTEMNGERKAMKIKEAVELKVTATRQAVAEERLVATNEQVAETELRKVAMEEKKFCMEEQILDFENEQRLMFMDISKMDEKQKLYVELCRDQFLAKKQMAYMSAMSVMGGMGTCMSYTGSMGAVPNSLEDPDYKVLELDVMVFCEKHGKAAERLVALDAKYAGRRKELMDDMKAEMAAEIAKRDAHTQKLNEKYELPCNLTSAQATVIQNLKLKNMTENELLSEARMNLELKNAEFTKFEEKLLQEKLELKFQVADLLNGKEKHNEEKYMLELKIVELMKAVEDLKEKIKGV